MAVLPNLIPTPPPVTNSIAVRRLTALMVLAGSWGACTSSDNGRNPRVKAELEGLVFADFVTCARGFHERIAHLGEITFPAPYVSASLEEGDSFGSFVVPTRDHTKILIIGEGSVQEQALDQALHKVAPFDRRVGELQAVDGEDWSHVYPQFSNGYPGHPNAMWADYVLPLGDKEEMLLMHLTLKPKEKAEAPDAIYSVQNADIRHVDSYGLRRDEMTGEILGLPPIAARGAWIAFNENSSCAADTDLLPYPDKHLLEVHKRHQERRDFLQLSLPATAYLTHMNSNEIAVPLRSYGRELNQSAWLLRALVPEGERKPLDPSALEELRAVFLRGIAQIEKAYPADEAEEYDDNAQFTPEGVQACEKIAGRALNVIASP